jgi:hypothetical protein
MCPSNQKLEEEKAGASRAVCVQAGCCTAKRSRHDVVVQLPTHVPLNIKRRLGLPTPHLESMRLRAAIADGRDPP